MLTTTVSVIIPAYNAANTLWRAISSCLQQTYAPLEVIVIDNASADETLFLAQSLAAQYKQIKVIQEPRPGAARARNAGLAVAQGQLIGFLDADDEWEPNKLAKILPCFVNPETALVAHNYRVEDRVLNCFAARHRLDDEFLALLLGNYLATSTVVARAEVVRQVNGFSGWLPLAEDHALWLKILVRHRLHMLPEVLTIRHNHPTSLTAKHSIKTRMFSWFVTMVAARHLFYKPRAVYEILSYLLSRALKSFGR